MRTATTVLNFIRERGQRGLPLTNLYRLLYKGMAAELARFGNVVTCHYETLLLVAHKANVNHRRGDQRDE